MQKVRPSGIRRQVSSGPGIGPFAPKGESTGGPKLASNAEQQKNADGRPILSRSATTAKGHGASDHTSLFQGCDLVQAKAELLQHLLGLLAEFRRPRHHRAGRA